MKINRFCIAILVPVLFISCDDTLSTVPDDRTEIDSKEKIKELLTNAYPTSLYTAWLEPRTDNAGDKTREAVEYRNNTEPYFWRDLFEDDHDYPTHYWNHAFEAIAQANQALESIEELGGGEDLDKYKAEALLARAYAYFMLVNIWGKNYDEGSVDSDMGLPYLEEPEKTLIVEYERGNLIDDYDKIEKDLQEALPLATDDYDIPTYHFTKDAAYAFATRYYLYIGDWDKVIEYGEKLFGNGASDLRDWTNAYDDLTYDEIKERFGDAEEPANLLVVSASSTFERMMADARYQLTVPLRNRLFTSNSPAGSWSYRIFGTDTHLNMPNYTEYFRYTDESAGIGYAYTNGVLLSTDEALLNLAEAYAMKDELGMATEKINDFLRVKTNGFSPLSESDIEDFYEVDPGIYEPFYDIPGESLPFINGITELRRREFYNQGLRWFDIKRFHLEVTHETDDGETHTLEKDDPRRVLQIPHEAVDFGLEENPR